MCVTQFVRREERGAEERAEPDGLPEPVEEAREVLESLVDRMVDTHLDDFELVCIGLFSEFLYESPQDVMILGCVVLDNALSIIIMFLGPVC